MNHPDAAFYAAVVMGALVAGALCGLMPLFAGRKRGRPGLGAAGMTLCLIAGFFGGIILAGPAGLISAGLILALCDAKPTARLTADWPPPMTAGWQVPTAGQAQATPPPSWTAAVPAAAPAATFARPAAPVAVGFHCTSCGHVPPPTQRRPPWCPACGADFKPVAPAPEPILEALPAEPEPATAASAGREEYGGAPW